MAWELSIINAKNRGRPLGERDEIIARFTMALPGVILQPTPRPSREFIAQMPEMLREHFMRTPKLNADFEGSDFSIQFYAEDKPQIDVIGAEVRGNGNPIPALAALCEANGWAVVNIADGALIDFTADDAPEWSVFRAWREKTLAAIRSASF